MWKLLPDIYLRNRFFYLFGGVVVVLVAGFWWPPLFFLGQVMLLAGIAVVIIDGLLLLARPCRFRVRRQLPLALSLGDTTEVTVVVTNRNAFPLHVGMVDELPVQLQVRDFYYESWMEPGKVPRLPTIYVLSAEVPTSLVVSFCFFLPVSGYWSGGISRSWQKSCLFTLPSSK
ncbi:MAG: hypothetical protein R2795_00425 [Saprospiraceae bacterium]